jgi:integrase
VAARKVLAPSYALHVAVSEHAQAVSQLGKSTLQEAVQFFLRHHRSDVGRMSLATLAEQFSGSRVQAGFSEKYVKNCQRHTQLLAQAFPSCFISDLSTEALDNWMGGISRFKPITKNQILKTLVTLGTWAEKRGYLIKGSNPFSGMVRYKEPKLPVAIFKPEELQILLAGVPKSVVPFVALGAFAGLRAAELQRLDWGEIDLNRGYITVAASKAKTRRRRLVPIADNLKLWLEPYRQESGPVSAHNNPQAVARNHCKGFKWAKNGLRHSYISYRLAVIHDTARVALEAGNSPEIIFGHYRELVTPEAANAWFSINP